MMNLGARFSRWLDRNALHPRLVEGGPDLHRRGQLAVAFAAVSGAGGCILGGNHIAYGVWLEGVLILLLGLGGFGAIAMLRRTGSLLAIGNVVAALWYLAMIASMFSRGGLTSHGSMGVAAVPVVAVVLANRRSGWVWCALSFALLAFAFGVEAIGIDVPDRAPPEARARIALISTCLFALLMFLMAMAHESMKSAAIADLARSERDKLAAETEAKLHEADRMAAVGRLAAGVAHEINNPLVYIIGNVDYLRVQLAAGQRIDPDQAGEALADVLEGAERVRTIVRDLGTFSRQDDEVRGVDVGEAVASAVRLVEHEIRHRATLRCDIRTNAPVLANEGRLGQVLVNLLVNAAQAVPVGRADGNEIAVVAFDEGTRVSIEVRDTGLGIPKELLDRVTEPFFTTKPVGEGTGLGLAVCKNIVERLGGSLEIDSTPGAGTTVRVSLPRARSASGRMPRARTERGAPAVALRILVIDDDPRLLRHVGRALDGHEVITADTGREALALLATDGDYDLVLCDLMMPDIPGSEVHDVVRARMPALSGRFALMTGGAFGDEMQKFLRRYDGPLLEKPFSDEQLHALLDRLAPAVAAAS